MKLRTWTASVRPRRRGTWRRMRRVLRPIRIALNDPEFTGQPRLAAEADVTVGNDTLRLASARLVKDTHSTITAEIGTTITSRLSSANLDGFPAATAVGYLHMDAQGTKTYKDVLNDPEFTGQPRLAAEADVDVGNDTLRLASARLVKATHRAITAETGTTITSQAEQVRTWTASLWTQWQDTFTQMRRVIRHIRMF